jgi:hypothetical protein
VSTAQDICDRAGRLLFGKDLSVAQSADALVALNGLLGRLNNERLACFAIRDESLTLNGSTSYTIGASGDLNTTRPVEIVSAYVVVSGTSYPVRLLTAQQRADISLKTSTATFPTAVYYEPDMPLGTLYPYPVASSGTLHLLTRTPLTAFAALTDTVTLPPGWDDLLSFHLTLALGPEFQVSVRPEVVQLAREAKASIKQTNSEPILATSDLSRLFAPRRSNIITDE